MRASEENKLKNVAFSNHKSHNFSTCLHRFPEIPRKESGFPENFKVETLDKEIFMGYCQTGKLACISLGCTGLYISMMICVEIFLD